MRVMIVVTHLLGTGHLSRALTLARAYRAAGAQVQVVSGGMPAPHLQARDVPLVQLPPLRSDGVDFATLLTAQGIKANDSDMAARRDQLCQSLRDMAPDLLITELYPFGRRSLAAEFTALLEAAHAQRPRPLICASIRDILAPPSKPAKAARTEAVITERYDAVLVHSVATLAPLDDSWPVTPALAQRLHYTGFVAPPPPQPDGNTAGQDAIIVSAGGGDVGQGIYAAAMDAARVRPDLRWHMLIGGGGADDPQWADAPANMVVEAAHPGFRAILLRARASVSMCGYNTALDVLQAGVPAVFIPFDAGAEVEQTLRAHALARQDAIAVLRNADLNADSLLRAIDDVLAASPRAALRDGMDGAAQCVEITRALLSDIR